MYSQHDEEDAIITELASYGSEVTGRLLDIGAYDGKTFSNSLRLIELGWRAVLVEPSPQAFLALLALHSERQHVTLVNVAIAAESLARVFHHCPDAVSTLKDEHAELWRGAGVPFQPYRLWTVTPSQLFSAVGYDFDFINIDVEGTNLEVFRAMPWEQLTSLKVICIEHEGRADAMEAMLGPGFERYFFNGENVIFRRARAAAVEIPPESETSSSTEPA